MTIVITGIHLLIEMLEFDPFRFFQNRYIFVFRNNCLK
jgi:hypothetical protein